MKNIITDKKEYKLLKSLCAITHWSIGFDAKFDLGILYANAIEYVDNKHPHFKNTIDIINIFKKYDISNIEAHKFWFLTQRERKQQQAIYQQKPTRVRQDNKTEINYGSGRGGGSSIRYPKKCRKTAWKRFYKLFPKLKK